jgi:hypothetical protein
MATYFYNEIKCQAKTAAGNACKNGAYFYTSTLDKHLCGVHSRKYSRVILKKKTLQKNDAIKILEKHAEICEEVARKNREKGRRGEVICTRIEMFGKPEQYEGFIKVFPNYRHGKRKDGLGIPSLSPMTLGPVKHGQPDLPDSKNLENFHQGNKVFMDEVLDGEITMQFYLDREEMYNDEIPHRHKKKRKVKTEFSIWVRKNGEELRNGYIESRQFYCGFYERLAREKDDFKKLVKMLNDGYNLQIVGYEGYHVNKSVEKLYLNPRCNFGHEIVLYIMLTESDPCKYPWIIHKTEEF